MTMNDVDDFLEHYGVKGMKWGVKSSNQVALKSARKEGRAEFRENLKDHYTTKSAKTGRKISVGRTAGSVILGTATFGAFNSMQIARAAGYSSGKSVAIGLLGNAPGALLASELKIRANARASVNQNGAG